MSGQRTGVLLMMLFLTLWMMVELIAARLVAGYTAYQVVWMRYGVHLVLMLLWWGWRDATSLLRTSRPAFQLTRSALMFVMPVSWYIARQSGVSAETTMTIFWLAPLWVLAVSSWWLREKASGTTWTLTLAAGVGAMIFYRPFQIPDRIWLLLAPLAMGLSFALYLAMTRSLRDEPIRANLFFTALGVFVMLTPAQPFVWITPSAADFARFVAVGVIGYATLHVLDRMAASAPLSATAPACYLQIPLLIAIGVSQGAFSLGTANLVALGLSSLPLVLLAAPSMPSLAPVRS